MIFDQADKSIFKAQPGISFYFPKLHTNVSGKFLVTFSCLQTTITSYGSTIIQDICVFFPFALLFVHSQFVLLLRGGVITGENIHECILYLLCNFFLVFPIFILIPCSFHAFLSVLCRHINISWLRLSARDELSFKSLSKKDSMATWKRETPSHSFSSSRPGSCSSWEAFSFFWNVVEFLKGCVFLKQVCFLKGCVLHIGATLG